MNRNHVDTDETEITAQSSKSLQGGATPDESNTNQKKEQAIPSLYEAYKDYFPIGAAINPRVLSGHLDLIRNHFNSITVENEMKFSMIHPAEGEYDFVKADGLVAFAVENHKKVRGHTLIWHNQTPGWVLAGKDGNEVSKEELLRRMEEHIKTVVGHYRGKVYCWDVVNEAVPDNGPEMLRNSKWQQIIGDEYIEKAFQYAHEADPDAILFYNDYNTEIPERRDKIFKLVKTLKEKGVPIQGVGLQCHIDIYSPSIEEIGKTIELFAGFGLQVQITELDMSVYSRNEKELKYVTPPEDRLMLQAQRYAEIFKLFRNYKGKITGVTFWGAADDSTWLDSSPVKGRKNWPLLFDTLQRPKEAFFKVTKFPDSY